MKKTAIKGVYFDEILYLRRFYMVKNVKNRQKMAKKRQKMAKKGGVMDPLCSKNRGIVREK